MNFFRMHRPTTDLDRNHCGNTNRNNDSKSSALMDESITATVEVVGTERVAKNALAANAKKYKYPVAGFRNKIEYSLLYSMMNSPGIYPLDVILDLIIAEDYTQYFYFNDATASDSYSHNSIDSVTTNHDPDATGGSSTNDSSVRPFCPPASYAQLVALLLVAVRHFPPPSSAPQEIADDDDEDDDEYEAFNRRRRFQRRQQQPKGKTETKSAVLPPTTTTTTRPTVVQALCQSMIQVITQHCEKFDLCPQKEIIDFFGMFYENTAGKKSRRDLTHFESEKSHFLQD